MAVRFVSFGDLVLQDSAFKMFICLPAPLNLEVGILLLEIHLSHRASADGLITSACTLRASLLKVTFGTLLSGPKKCIFHLSPVPPFLLGGHLHHLATV